MTKKRTLAEKSSKYDIERKFDLFFKICNLTSLEEHSAFNFMQTGEKKWHDLWKFFREMRVRNVLVLLEGKKLKYDEWCMVGKHFFNAFYRSLEVAVGVDFEEAKKQIEEAKELFTIFWSIVEGKK